MKESLLRETIRKEIRKSLKEVDVTGRAETGIARLEKQPGIKMLKTALSSGTPKQQAAGLLKVINLVSGGSRAVKSQLVQMLQQGGLEVDEPAAEPVAEGIFDFLKKKKKEAPKAKVKGNEPIGVDYDGNYIYAEANKFQMGKKRTAGLQQKDLGGASDVKRATGMFADIAKLEPKKKVKALAYLIKQAGVDKDTFNSYKQKIATYLNQLR